MASADPSLPPQPEVTYVKYEQLHQSLLFFRYVSSIALWVTCLIFFIRVVFIGVLDNQGGLSLFYVVICSIIMFWAAVFSHHIIDWDRLITSLKYPTKRWRCHCNRCLSRRRHGNISKLTPTGLHAILANSHSWTLLSAVLSFFLMLALTDASGPFHIVLVILFICGEVAFLRLSKSAVEACRNSLNVPLQMPQSGITQPTSSKTPMMYDQTVVPFRAIIDDVCRNERVAPEHEDDHVTFSMKRTVLPDGKGQHIDGWLKMVFQLDQLQVTQHVPFTPVFDTLPSVVLDSQSDIEIVVDKPVIMLHGMRFDVKRRSHDPEVNNTVIIYFSVES